MKKFIIVTILGLLSVPALSKEKSPLPVEHRDDALFESFKTPPNEARPYIRWWWGGNVLNAEELMRELDVFKDAGLGGVEINPAGGGISPKTPGHKAYIWLSPEWCDLVKLTAEEASKRGLSTDLIGGTGWPYGGEFLKPDQQIQTIYTHYYPVESGELFTKTFKELLQNAHVNDYYHKKMVSWGEFKLADTPDATVKPSFATLIPCNPASFSELRDVTHAFRKDGSLEVHVPKGKYVLAVGIWRQGEQVRKVSVSTPGGGGPVLDHFAKGVPREYFERMSKALEASFGAPMGDYLRSMFVDSIELRSANWTADFKREFKKRAGYDMTPWIPLVMSEDGGANTIEGVKLQSELKAQVRRVCYDRNRVLCDLYQERFVAEFHDWCQKHGVLSRYQSYGTPWLLDLGNTSMMTDIPESNDWLTDRFKHGWGIWHKYTSSATNLTGKKVTSSESMTNTKADYSITLAEIKRAMDLNFILGINHVTLHGNSYCPRSLPYPGRTLFGSFFSDRNTWWPWFKNWADYTARLSSVFQNTAPVAQFAVLAPTSDIWSDFGLSRNVFHNSPKYLQKLVESIGQNGGSADYITEEVLQQSTVVDRKLCFGPMAYPVVIVAEARTVAPETAEALLRFAAAGGQIVFLGDALQQSRGLSHAQENDARVKEAQKQIMRKSQIARLTPPRPDNTLGWVNDTLLPSVHVELPLHFSELNPDLHQLHKIDKNREVFFFCNQNDNTSIVTEVNFKTSGKTPWVWNPHTAQRSVYPFDGNKIQLELGPQESLLIVREPSASAMAPDHSPLCSAQEELKELTGNWDCTFTIIESDSFERTTTLMDLSKSEDPALASFGGTVSYRKSFTGTGIENSILDLGIVHGISEVWINGTPIGTRWFGQHRYELNGLIRDGNNTLEVQVTTVALNYIKSLPKRPKHQVEKQNPAPTGLVGPVRFLSR
jgi:hypothetical protein